jgi:hypothetical protein
MKEGIELDDTTWGQLVDTWMSVGLDATELEATVGAKQ